MISVESGARCLVTHGLWSGIGAYHRSSTTVNLMYWNALSIYASISISYVANIHTEFG